MRANAEQQRWIRWTMLKNDMTRRSTEDKKEKHLAYNFYGAFQQIDVIVAFLGQIISLWVYVCPGSPTFDFLKCVLITTTVADYVLIWFKHSVNKHIFPLRTWIVDIKTYLAFRISAWAASCLFKTKTQPCPKLYGTKTSKPSLEDDGKYKISRIWPHYRGVKSGGGWETARRLLIPAFN